MHAGGAVEEMKGNENKWKGMRNKRKRMNYRKKYSHVCNSYVYVNLDRLVVDFVREYPQDDLRVGFGGG